jgi:hypothetical protein
VGLADADRLEFRVLTFLAGVLVGSALALAFLRWYPDWW